MENEIAKKLKVLIEALTHSGSNTLDHDIFKQVKKICKSSQEYISNTYNIVMTQLKKNNSQIRLAAFQICLELFKRSVVFRENVLRDLHQIFELTAEITASKKLPPPKSSAIRLKSLAISTLKEWVKEFGETYKKLQIAYNYFEKCKHVDFVTLQVGNTAEQIVENEQQRHLRAVDEGKIKRVLEEFNNNKSEIEMTITSLSNCLSLLLPPAEEFFIPEHSLLKSSNQTDNVHTKISNEPCSSRISNDVQDEEVYDDNESCYLASKNKLRDFGIPLNYSLTLQLDIGNNFKVEKTEENISVINNAKDCVRLISIRFLPMIKKWIKIFCKCSNGNNNEIKKIIDLQEKLENILKKYNSIVIDDSLSILNEEKSSDDEFEEVKKEGYEEAVDFSEHLLLECLKKSTDVGNPKVNSQTSQSLLEAETVQIASTSKPDSNGESSGPSQEMNRKKKLLSVAPKLPFDIDLYHWEDEKLSAPTLISSKMDVDKFWGCAGSDDIHEIPNPEGIAALRTRVIEYAGTFEPVKWSCRAPLPNGKLCPRKDRYKCPFHGKIVPRDEVGNIENKNDLKDVNQTTGNAPAVPEFQDFEFLKDLQAATGLNLKIPEKRGKKRISKDMNLTHKKMKTSTAALKLIEAKQHPGLFDVFKKQNNIYARLSKKIFNKSSLRKVSSVLDKLDRKKFHDKFGDQFNYI